VSASDLNIDPSKSKLIKKSIGLINVKGKKVNKELLFLDEETGLFITKTDLNLKNEDNEDLARHLDMVECFDISQYQDITTPESLSKYCITVINSCFVQSVNCEKTSLAPEYLSRLQTSTKTAIKSNPVKNKKITILADVIIKAGTSNVCYLNEVSNKIENKPFIASSNNDLPECLQVNKTRHLKKVKNEWSRKGKKVNREDKVKGKKCKLMKKKKDVISDSGSSTILGDDEVVTVDTDNSDYETLNDYYIAECLREQSEKENFEPTNIPFGLHDIEYFEENHKNIQKDDWVIAQFASKKYLKHFVGNVLLSDDEFPTIKFVRKVKESKCETGTTFTYPIVDDICTMRHLEDVITVLPKPQITRRRRIVFNVDFSGFNIQ
jgi:hypothetical protein